MKNEDEQSNLFSGSSADQIKEVKQQIEIAKNLKEVKLIEYDRLDGSADGNGIEADRKKAQEVNDFHAKQAKNNYYVDINQINFVENSNGSSSMILKRDD